MVMIGVSENDDTGDAEVIPTQAELQTYLAAVGANWTAPNSEFPNDPTKALPFDPIAAAQWVWGRLDALNAH
jgi:hypothetical protein